MNLEVLKSSKSQHSNNLLMYIIMFKTVDDYQDSDNFTHSIYNFICGIDNFTHGIDNFTLRIDNVT